MQASATAEQLDKAYKSTGDASLSSRPSSSSSSYGIDEEKETSELDKAVMDINIDSLAVVGEMDDTFDTHGDDAIKSIDQVIAQMPPNSKSLDAALVSITHFTVLITRVIYIIHCLRYLYRADLNSYIIGIQKTLN